MLFSELYGDYYNAVAEILRLAVRGELNEQSLKKITAEKAFGESVTVIPAALKTEKWQLITKDLKTPIKAEPSMPLTLLQRRWLKAVSLDPRIRLFDADLSALEGVAPLFPPEAVCYYDKYSDGDDFTDEGYIKRFKIILKAIKERTPLKIKYKNKNGLAVFSRAMPEHLEYSEKDDKFRLITSGCRYGRTIKLSSITAVIPGGGERLRAARRTETEKAKVTFTLFDARNTLERAMLHFAHLEKTVERTEEKSYTVTLLYDPSDETEILIRILSFGPFIRVTKPESFVNIIKERLLRQKAFLP